MNLYERPRNTFVAAFIGSPSMNLLSGAIVVGAGVSTPEFRAADNTFSMPLSGEWAQRLAGYGGRAVIMGVRPDDIVIVPDGSVPLGTGTVRVRLDVVEPLGSEAFLSTRIGAKEITARVPPRGMSFFGRLRLEISEHRLEVAAAESRERDDTGMSRRKLRSRRGPAS
jgi:multiple sugar transport system ATP-binding protein